MIANTSGYTKSHRRVVDSLIWRRHANYYKLWEWLQKQAYWREGEALSLGRVETSWKALCDALTYEEDGGRTVTYSRNTPRKIIDWMVGQEMVEIMDSTRGRGGGLTLQIVNWEKYQGTIEAQSTDLTMEVDENFTPEVTHFGFLLEEWGRENLPRSVDQLQQENALRNLHLRKPHWSIDQLRDIIAKVKANKNDGLRWVWRRGPVALRRLLKDGQQVAEYAYNYEPFRRNHERSNSYRQSNAEHAHNTIDDLLGFAQDARTAERGEPSANTIHLQ